MRHMNRALLIWGVLSGVLLGDVRASRSHARLPGKLSDRGPIRLCWQRGPLATASRPEQIKAERGRFEEKRIFLGSFRRAVDFCISEKDGLCWVLNDLSDNMNVVDLHEGRLAGSFGGFISPQACHYLPTSNRLLVVDEARDSRGAVVRLLDAATGVEKKQIAVRDWRAYRISSTALSEDETTLWLVTACTHSSLYGPVRSVLYKIDLRSGRSELCMGPARPDMETGTTAPGRMACVLGPNGRLFFWGHEPNTISEYDTSAGEARCFLRLEEEFDILAADADRGRLYVCFAAGNIAEVDTDKAALASTIETNGRVTAMCLVPHVQELVYLVEGSGEAQVLDARTLDNKYAINLPGITKGAEGAVAKMCFDKGAKTLVVAARNGNALVLYDTLSGAARVLDVGNPTCVRVGPGGERIYICHAQTGNISMVDAKTDKFLGTIQLGGSLWDVDFLHKKNHAVVADVAGARVVLLDLDTLKILREFITEQKPWRVIVSEDDRRCLVSFDRLWDFESSGRAVLDFKSGIVTRVRTSELREAWPQIPKREYSLAVERRNGGLYVRIPGFLRSTHYVPIGSASARRYLASFGYEMPCVALSPDERWAYVACQISPANAVLLKVAMDTD